MISDIYDILETVAVNNSLEHYYGIKGYMNIKSNYEALAGKTVCYVAPIVKNETLGSPTRNPSETYDTLIFIGKLETIDKDYKDKYLDTIRDLEPIINAVCKQANCLNDDYLIETCKISEVINEFNGNLDGYYAEVRFVNEFN